MKKILIPLLMIFAFMVLPGLMQNAAAQPPPPPPQPIPFDGGLLFLIAAGATYGARKLYKQQKEDNS